MPAQRRDCLPPALRAALGLTDDPDDFIVWTDDDYGDDGDRETPPVPVSRIPDAHSAVLLRPRSPPATPGAATPAAASATSRGRSPSGSSPRFRARTRC